MSFENRGGTPVVRRVAVTTGGIGTLGYQLPAVSKFLQISNEGANILRIYFTEPDYTADVNYIELAASTGFFEGPTEISSLWFRSTVGSTTAVFITYCRRG